MKLRLFAAATAALGALALAGAASAAVTVSATEIDNLYGDGSIAPVSGNVNVLLSTHGQTMLDDFDAILAPEVTYTGNILQGPNGSSTSASPPYDQDELGDETKYASVQANQTATFETKTGWALSSFSFYMGSPDDYNHISFYSKGVLLETLSGEDIWGGLPGQANGNRDWGYRIYYDFGGASVDKITFESTGKDAFEFDGLAGTITGVPEPMSWALMIMGFGGVGATLRSRRRVAATA